MSSTPIHSCSGGKLTQVSISSFYGAISPPAVPKSHLQQPWLSLGSSAPIILPFPLSCCPDGDNKTHTSTPWRGVTAAKRSCAGTAPVGPRAKPPLKSLPSSEWQHSHPVPCCHSFLGNRYTLPLVEMVGEKAIPQFSILVCMCAKNIENIWITEHMFYYFMSCWLLPVSHL